MREEKIAEIRKLKEHYDGGYWNANSVLLGGLGKYPYIAGTCTTSSQGLSIGIADEQAIDTRVYVAIPSIYTGYFRKN